MKLVTTAKILAPLLIVVLILPIIVYAQINKRSITPKKPWAECRKNYRQALKDESKLYISTIRTANANYRQALKSTRDINDKETRKQFLQEARTETKNEKKSALHAIKTNKKMLKAEVKVCENEVK